MTKAVMVGVPGQRSSVASSLGICVRTAMGLIQMDSLGIPFGVSVRGMESSIRLGSIIPLTDYWRHARTEERAGREQRSVSDLTCQVEERVTK